MSLCHRLVDTEIGLFEARGFQCRVGSFGFSVCVSHPTTERIFCESERDWRPRPGPDVLQ
jgi:hypothetical protein